MPVRPWRLVVAAAIAAAGAALAWLFMPAGTGSPADPDDPTQVARGAALYAEHCASCHGQRLEGQAGWQTRRPDGRLPAPPHDETGHTWHHPDGQLFRLTRDGLVPPLVPPGYQSDMPGFAGTLTDREIWDVLAYIKSRWPPAARERQADITRRAGG